MNTFRRRVAVTAVVLVALLAAGAWLESHRHTWDLTAEDHLTLSDQTREIVEAVEEPVRITAFIRRAEAGRAEAAALLSRYRRLNRRIAYRVVDPDEAPGEVQRLNVDPASGGVVVSDGERNEQVPLASEQDITAALARLLRPGDAVACFAIGHGEADPGTTTGEGLSQAAGLLRVNGYRVERHDLLVNPQVPPQCKSVIVATPLAPLGPAEDALAQWVAAGGRLLLLADPVSTVDLPKVLGPAGLALDRGIVFEVNDEARLRGDAVTLVIRDYRSASPIVRRLPPAVLPGAQGVLVTDEQLATRVGQTSAESFLERQPGEPRFDPGADRRGPVIVAAASDHPRNEGDRIVRSRVAVIGDGDFATNAYLSDAGNSRLFIQTVDWLTLREDLVSVSPNIPDFRPLELTDARLRYARLVTSGSVPLLFLLLGAFVWALRRAR